MNKLPLSSCVRCENLLADLSKCLEAFKTFISVDSTVDPNILVTSLEQLFKKSSQIPGGKSTENQRGKSYRMQSTQTDPVMNSNSSSPVPQCKCQMVKIEPIDVQKKTPVLTQKKNQETRVGKKSGKRKKGDLGPKAFRSKNAYDFVPPATLKKASASVREVSMGTAGGDLSYKIFECVKCHRQFPRRANAQNHFLIMHEKQGVRCEKCRKMYFSKEVFRRHNAACNVVNTWRDIRTQAVEKVKKSPASGSKSLTAAQSSKSVTTSLKPTVEPSSFTIKTEGGKTPIKIKVVQGKPAVSPPTSSATQATKGRQRQRVTRDVVKRLEVKSEFESGVKNTKTTSQIQPTNKTKNQSQNDEGNEKIRLNTSANASSSSSFASTPLPSNQPKKIFGNMMTKSKTTRNFLMENQNGKLSRVFSAGKKSPAKKNVQE